MSRSTRVFQFFHRYRRNSVRPCPSGGLALTRGHGSNRIWTRIAAGIPVLLGVISPAHAASTGAPWEAPLQSFLNSLTGPVAQIVGVAAVVIAGFGIAFSEGGGGLRKLVWVAMGLSIAFAATTFFLPLFGFGGGLAF